MKTHNRKVILRQWSWRIVHPTTTIMNCFCRRGHPLKKMMDPTILGSKMSLINWKIRGWKPKDNITECIAPILNPKHNILESIAIFQGIEFIKLINHYPSINLSFLFLSSFMTGFWCIFYWFFCLFLKNFQLIFTLISSYLSIFLELLTFSGWWTGMWTFPWKPICTLCSSVSSINCGIRSSDSKDKIISCFEESMMIFLLTIKYFHLKFRIEKSFLLFDMCELNLFLFIFFLIFPQHRYFLHVDSMQELFFFLVLFILIEDLFFILN